MLADIQSASQKRCLALLSSTMTQEDLPEWLPHVPLSPCHCDENAQLEQACTHALDWGVPSSVECLPSPAWIAKHPGVRWVGRHAAAPPAVVAAQLARMSVFAAFGL